MTHPAYLESDAVISDCGKYRYLLRRTWDHARPRALYVMLNPSTADASVDDPTIKSCVRLAKAIGYGSLEAVNLFAWRATDPTELAKVTDAIGPDNDGVIAAAVMRCDIPIVAWGAHSRADGRGYSVWQAIKAKRPAVFCLGTTKSGAPRHPLYVSASTPLEAYRP